MSVSVLRCSSCGQRCWVPAESFNHAAEKQRADALEAERNALHNTAAKLMLDDADKERLDWLEQNVTHINGIEAFSDGTWIIWWEDTPASDPRPLSCRLPLRQAIDAGRKPVPQEPKA